MIGTKLNVKLITILLFVCMQMNELSAQGATKYGESTNSSTNFVDQNGKVSSVARVSKIGKKLLAPGDTYGGGKVAYILQSGDPGYSATEQHGLIAALADQSTGIRWNNGSNTTTGAIATAIGTGLANTNTIITKQGATATSYAAGLARAYTGGGYSDWYLPSKDELNKLYLNRVVVGGFASAYYWSSSESSKFNAGVQTFANGTQTNLSKNNAYYVRAVRAF